MALPPARRCTIGFGFAFGWGLACPARWLLVGTLELRGAFDGPSRSISTQCRMGKSEFPFSVRLPSCLFLFLFCSSSVLVLVLVLVLLGLFQFLPFFLLPFCLLGSRHTNHLHTLSLVQIHALTSYDKQYKPSRTLPSLFYTLTSAPQACPCRPNLRQVPTWSECHH